MKITNTFHPLSEANQKILAKIRQNRGFDVQQYVDLKTDLLVSYMKNAGLTACVVAVSGGIDSAVVLALVQQASFKYDIKIVPATLPSLDNSGVTNQRESIFLNHEL